MYVCALCSRFEASQPVRKTEMKKENIKNKKFLTHLPKSFNPNCVSVCAAVASAKQNNTHKQTNEKERKKRLTTWCWLYVFGYVYAVNLLKQTFIFQHHRTQARKRKKEMDGCGMMRCHTLWWVEMNASEWRTSSKYRIYTHKLRNQAEITQPTTTATKQKTVFIPLVYRICIKINSAQRWRKWQDELSSRNEISANASQIKSIRANLFCI